MFTNPFKNKKKNMFTNDIKKYGHKNKNKKNIFDVAWLCIVKKERMDPERGLGPKFLLKKT